MRLPFLLRATKELFNGWLMWSGNFSIYLLCSGAYMCGLANFKVPPLHRYLAHSLIHDFVGNVSCAKRKVLAVWSSARVLLLSACRADRIAAERRTKALLKCANRRWYPSAFIMHRLCAAQQSPHTNSFKYDWTLNVHFQRVIKIGTHRRASMTSLKDTI